MCRPHSLLCFPSFAVLAAALIPASALVAQAPLQSATVPAASTEISIPAITGPAISVPAIAGPAAEAFTAPQAVPGPVQSAEAPALQPQSTPEEVGDSLMAHQRYQAAIAAYKKEPQLTAELWNKIGIAYQLMFSPEEASRCYQASLRMNAKNARVLNNLGTIYDSLKEYSNAERMYRKAIKLDPNSAMIYKNLGTNLLTQHRYKKGWEAYKTALEIDPHIFQKNASPRIENPASVAERGAMNYYMAKGCLRAGMNECAIDYLRMALNEGFTSAKKIQADSEFAGLRGMPAFQQLISEQRQQ